MSAVLRDTPAAEAEEIVSSSFVLDTLQTALWTVLHGADFEHAVTIAVNMGNDATAAGATTGALAGAVYGESGIPARWLDAAHRARPRDRRRRPARRTSPASAEPRPRRRRRTPQPRRLRVAVIVHSVVYVADVAIETEGERGRARDDAGAARCSSRSSGCSTRRWAARAWTDASPAWLLLADPPGPVADRDRRGPRRQQGGREHGRALAAPEPIVERVSEPGQRGDFYRVVARQPRRRAAARPRPAPCSGSSTAACALVADKDQTQSNYALLHELREFTRLPRGGDTRAASARWQAPASGSPPRPPAPATRSHHERLEAPLELADEDLPAQPIDRRPGGPGRPPRRGVRDHLAQAGADPRPHVPVPDRPHRRPGVVAGRRGARTSRRRSSRRSRPRAASRSSTRSPTTA